MRVLSFQCGALSSTRSLAFEIGTSAALFTSFVSAREACPLCFGNGTAWIVWAPGVVPKNSVPLTCGLISQFCNYPVHYDAIDAPVCFLVGSLETTVYVESYALALTLLDYSKYIVDRHRGAFLDFLCSF